MWNLVSLTTLAFTTSYRSFPLLRLEEARMLATSSNIAAANLPTNPPYPLNLWNEAPQPHLHSGKWTLDP